MRKFLLLFCLLLLPLGGVVLAQTRTVSGVVISSEDNLPIIGASVLLEGTKAGAVTDANGKFQIKIPTSSQKSLVISYIGMKTISVASSGNNLRIVLHPDATSLDEVVTVGYSKATKRSFTGSATTIKADALERKNVASVSNALAAEVPGVTVINNNGQPGSNATIYVRGVGSVNAGTAPLYVVDGIPFDGSISTLNPADIESTTLLKDAASMAIYGARAANGVILITTKQGAVGGFRVSADIKYGINTTWLPRHSVLSNPDEYLEIGWEGLKNYRLNSARTTITDEEAAQWASKNLFGGESIHSSYNYFRADADKVIDPTTGKIYPGLERKYTPENWFEELLQSSSRTETNVQLSGGTNKLRAFTSLGYLSDKGVSKNTDYSRLSGRINVDFNPYSWISTTARLNYTSSRLHDPGQNSASSANVFAFANNVPPVYPLYLRDSDGNKILSPYYEGVYEFDYGNSRGFQGSTNAVANTVFNTEVETSNRIAYNLGVTLRFLDGFSLENTLGGSYTYENRKERSSKWYGDNATSGGTIEQQGAQTISYNLLSLLRYSKRFGTHSLEAFVAHEANGWDYDLMGASKKGLIDPFGTSLSNALNAYGQPSGREDQVNIESYFSQVNYDYQNKYFASATFRRDGSSKFLNGKWGSFGSLGLAWVASEETFFKGIKHILPYLKVKASYGTLGHQDGLSSYYVGRRLYNFKNANGDLALTLRSVDDPQLSWERSTMFQIGTEFNLGRFLSANIEFYNKRSSDLIYDRRVSPSRGYAVKKVNDGVLVNRGVDIDMTAHLLRGSDYRLDFRVNAGFLSNKMLTMPLDPSTGKQKFIDTSVDNWGRQANRSLYDYYIQEYAGVERETGRSQWTLYYHDVDNNGSYDTAQGDTPISSYEEFVNQNPDAHIGKTVTTKYTEATRSFVGKSGLPTVRGGFSISGAYKGIELDILFAYGLGGYGYDNIYSSLMGNRQLGSYNLHTDMRNRWTPENKDSDIPRLNNGFDTNVTSTSTRFLTSNSFLQLSNVRLGYSLPTHWISPLRIKSLRIWISGDNLALLSARRGYNPALSLTGQSSTTRYNPVSTITGGLNINF